MTIAPIPQQVRLPHSKADFCLPRLSDFLKTVTQVAIRILFVLATLMASNFFIPINWEIVLLPILCSSTILSAHFFPVKIPIERPIFNQRSPLIINNDLLLQEPENIEVPRGLNNASQNCAFNSLLQFMECDDGVKAFFRSPLENEASLERVIEFFRMYLPEDEELNNLRNRVIQTFRNFVQREAEKVRQGQEDLPFPRDFLLAFIHRIRPPINVEEKRVIDRLKDIFPKLIEFQNEFFFILNQIDLAKREGSGIAEGANTQLFRLAVSRISALISGNQNVQEDVGVIMSLLYELLPPHLKCHTETTQFLENPFTPDKAPQNAILPSKCERSPFIPLQLPDRENPISFSELIRNYQSSKEHENYKCFGIDGVERQYPIERVEIQFLSPPPEVLRFQLLRFRSKKRAQSWLSNWFSFLFPHEPYSIKKVKTPVDVPEVLSIRTKDGQEHQYRFVSFIHHNGETTNSGHYTQGSEINGIKYLANDKNISRVNHEASQATWDERKSQGYLFSYVLEN